MRPNRPVANHVNQRVGYSVLSAKLLRIWRNRRTNFSNLIVGQLSHPIPRTFSAVRMRPRPVRYETPESNLPTWIRISTMTLFLRHVCHVLSMGGHKQVTRITAVSNITPMTHKVSWPYPAVQKIREARTENRATSLHPETGIAEVFCCSSGGNPFPTPAVAVGAMARGFVDMEPEGLNLLRGKFGRRSIRLRHKLEASFRHVLGSASVLTAPRWAAFILA